MTESAEKDLDMAGAPEAGAFCLLLPVLGVLVRGEEVGETTSSSSNDGSVLSRILESERLLVMPCEACAWAEEVKEVEDEDWGV